MVVESTGAVRHALGVLLKFQSVSETRTISEINRLKDIRVTSV